MTSTPWTRRLSPEPGGPSPAGCCLEKRTSLSGAWLKKGCAAWSSLRCVSLQSPKSATSERVKVGILGSDPTNVCCVEIVIVRSPGIYTRAVPAEPSPVRLRRRKQRSGRGPHFKWADNHSAVAAELLSLSGRRSSAEGTATQGCRRRRTFSCLSERLMAVCHKNQAEVMVFSGTFNGDCFEEPPVYLCSRAAMW